MDREELGAENARVVATFNPQLKPMEPGEWEPGMKIPDISEDINPPQNPANARQVGSDHYKKMDIQPWDAMEAWLSPEEFKGFLIGNCIKYVARAGKKGPYKEDIEKAKHYLEKLLEVI